MKSITAVSIAIIALFITSLAWGAGGDEIIWNAQSKLADGRQLLTDGSLILDSRYISDAPLPKKAIPSQNVQRLLQSDTDHEFDLDDLEKGAGGHYVAPRSVKLNNKYIDFLRRAKASIRFRAKGPMDPILILDGEDVVGVVMPVK